VVEMEAPEGVFGMFWRFFAASDPCAGTPGNFVNVRYIYIYIYIHVYIYMRSVFGMFWRFFAASDPCADTLIRNRPTLAPYSRFMSRALWWT